MFRAADDRVFALEDHCPHKGGPLSQGIVHGTAVTANVLLPAVIDTPATRRSLPYADYVNWPTPDEIAAVAHFLLSEDSGVINGAEIPVYGRA